MSAILASAKGCYQFSSFIITGRTQAKLPKQMRSFDESQKSKKTVASMIERKGDKDAATAKKIVKIVETKKEQTTEADIDGGKSEDVIAMNRRKLAEKLSGKKKVDSK